MNRPRFGSSPRITWGGLSAPLLAGRARKLRAGRHQDAHRLANRALSCKNRAPQNQNPSKKHPYQVQLAYLKTGQPV